MTSLFEHDDSQPINSKSLIKSLTEVVKLFLGYNWVQLHTSRHK